MIINNNESYRFFDLIEKIKYGNLIKTGFFYFFTLNSENNFHLSKEENELLRLAISSFSNESLLAQLKEMKKNNYQDLGKEVIKGHNIRLIDIVFLGAISNRHYLNDNFALNFLKLSLDLINEHDIKKIGKRNSNPHLSPFFFSERKLCSVTSGNSVTDDIKNIFNEKNISEISQKLPLDMVALNALEEKDLTYKNLFESENVINFASYSKIMTAQYKENNLFELGEFLYKKIKRIKDYNIGFYLLYLTQFFNLTGNGWSKIQSPIDVIKIITGKKRLKEKNLINNINALGKYIETIPELKNQKIFDNEEITLLNAINYYQILNDLTINNLEYTQENHFTQEIKTLHFLIKNSNRLKIFPKEEQVITLLDSAINLPIGEDWDDIYKQLLMLKKDNEEKTSHSIKTNTFYNQIIQNTDEENLNFQFLINFINYNDYFEKYIDLNLHSKYLNILSKITKFSQEDCTEIIEGYLNFNIEFTLRLKKQLSNDLRKAYDKILLTYDGLIKSMNIEITPELERKFKNTINFIEKLNIFDLNSNINNQSLITERVIELSTIYLGKKLILNEKTNNPKKFKI